VQTVEDVPFVRLAKIGAGGIRDNRRHLSGLHNLHIHNYSLQLEKCRWFCMNLVASLFETILEPIFQTSCVAWQSPTLHRPRSSQAIEMHTLRMITQPKKGLPCCFCCVRKLIKINRRWIQPSKYNKRVNSQTTMPCYITIPTNQHFHSSHLERTTFSSSYLFLHFLQKGTLKKMGGGMLIHFSVA
jgi:hypothetical protein